MENTLERVSTVQQTSTGSTRLPLELQQQVFSYLDTKSFHAARRVCRWWRFASLDAVTLSRQLQKLPILPPVSDVKGDLRKLNRLFEKAAYNLMLGVKIQRKPGGNGLLRTAQQIIGPQVTATTNGQRTVTLNNRTLALFDTSGEKAACLAQRPLDDLKQTIGNGPWSRVTPTAYHEMALSSNGRLVAIAQERTIKIHDMTAEADSHTVNQYVSSAAGHYICGLDFEQNDHVLRVRLSGKGAILYLGTPVVGSSGPANIEHWKSKAGLKHVFLDTSILSTSFGGEPEDHPARLAGLQLLHPFHNGYLFAAQRHGGNISSHYVLGHVKCSVPPNDHALTAEVQSVTILAKLESFLSAWSYSLNGNHEDGAGMWENMPSAHEHHPTYALSPSFNVLVLAERDKKAMRPCPLTGIFVYRVPTEQAMVKTLQEHQKRSERWTARSKLLNRLEVDVETCRDIEGKVSAAEQKNSVARIPLCLSTVQGVVTGMKCEQLEHGEGKALALSVETAETTRVWNLLET